MEQLLERYGDTLYRIAILFAASPAQAHELLLRFARSYATQPVPSDDQQLLEAILPFMAAIPDRRQANTQHALRPMLDTLPAAESRLLSAILKLPRAQRAALAFQALQLPFEEAMQLDEQPLSELRRDALLALAESANRPTLASALTDPEVDELCRTTRAAMVLENPGQHHIPTVRGHLALCTDCRSLAQSWQGLLSQISDMLRSILRGVHMPEEFGERMLAAAEPAPTKDLRSMLRSPWLIRMALPLFVLTVIGLLVLWRPAEEQPGPTVTGATPTNLQELVAQAQTNLYSAQLQGVEHQRYQMRWPFNDGSYAPMIGEIWRDSSQKQLRAQLTHEAGGAPYEFLLTGRGAAWYGVTTLYGESIYPLVLEPDHTRVQLQLNDQQLQELTEATLAKGAWGIPYLYLEKARMSALQSWGRQRLEDGTLVEVIGYRSDAAFSMQSSLQSIQNLEVTVLLLIDPGKGQLRELREVFGPPGGDQVSRTLWRFLDSELLSDEQQIGRTFNIAFAWNGTGTFEDSQSGFIDAALPLISQHRLAIIGITPDGGTMISTEDSAAYMSVRMPMAAPNKSKSAFMIVNPGQESSGISIIYVGKDREFIFRNMADTPANQALFPTDQHVETVTAGPYQALVRPVPGGYTSMLRLPPDVSAQPTLMLTYARGYSREEMLASLASLTTLSAESLKTQIELFASSNSPPAVRELLLAALRQEHSIPADMVRRVKAHTYSRQMAAPDALSDPYHRRLYNGIPDKLNVTRWLYPALSDPTVIAAQYEERRGEDNSLYGSLYTDEHGTLFYNHVYELLDGPVINYQPAHIQEQTLLKAILCGGGHLQQQEDGSQTVTFSEQGFTGESCLWPDYVNIMSFQLQTNVTGPFFEDQPYVADLGGAVLTLTLTLDQQKLRKIETSTEVTTITISQNGQSVQLRTQAGGTVETVIVQSWELLDDSLIPLTEAPSREERAALTKNAVALAPIPETILIQQVTLTNTLQLAGGRMFVPAQPEQAEYYVATSQRLVGSNFQTASNTVFELALWQGVAVQMLLPVRESNGQIQNIIIYQGAAEPFRTFLQRYASWQSSGPDQAPLAGQLVDGWFVMTPDGSSFTLVERDGVLLALPRLWSVEQEQAQYGLQLRVEQ